MSRALSQHVKRMIEAPVRRLILTLAVPTIASMLITTLYNMADAWFLGRLDTASVAAVGIAFPAMAIVQALAFFCGHGAGNTMSRMLGANRLSSARKMVATGCVLSFVIGLCVALLGLCFGPWLARCFGAPEVLRETARIYLQIVLLGAPWMCLSLTMNNLLRFQGKAFFAMVGILSGGVLNLLLDPLFIFVFGWGIYGAAIATITGQCLSFLILLLMLQKQGVVGFRWAELAFTFEVWRDIFRGGMPSLFRQGLGAFAFTALNHAAGAYGATAAIAAMSVVTRIVMVLYAVVIGLGQGFQPVCGFSYGAQKFRRVYDAFIFLVWVSALFLGIAALPCWFFAEALIAHFRPDPMVVTIGATTLRWQMATLVLSAWIIPCNMLTQTVGMGKVASLLASARQGLFFLPFIVLLPLCLGLQGVMMAQACADGYAFVLAFVLSLSLVRRLRQGRA
jgi:putative MATE family efflux protein